MVKSHPNSRSDDYYIENDYSNNRWRLLTILLLGMAISQTPLIYGHYLFLEGGIIKNYFMFIVLLPLLFLVLITSVILILRRLTINSYQIFSPLLGTKKRFDILGAICLSIINLMINAILFYAFKQLHISTKNFVFTSSTIPEIWLLVFQTLLLVIVTPIVEEVFWRIYAQEILQRTFGRSLGLFAQAVLFALLHIRDFVGRLSVFFLGLTLGIWRDRKRTLMPLVVTHIIINSLYCTRLWFNYFEQRMVRTTHNYQVLLEELCKPDDYEHEKNALSNYRRAFDLFVEKPNELVIDDLNVWPTNLSNVKKELLNNWILSNQFTIIEFEAGTQKSYYCPEYSKESFKNITFPSLSKGLQIVYIILSRAKLKAIEGDIQQSISDILTCYRYGQHLTGPKPLTEQLVGLRIKDRAINTAFMILKRTSVEDSHLSRLQFELEFVTEKELAPIDFSAERLVCYDLIQRLFTNGRIGGDSTPQITHDMMVNPPTILQRLGIYGLSDSEALEWKKLRRKNTTHLTEVVFAYLDSIKNRTPAELHGTEQSIEYALLKFAKGNVFLLEFIPAYVNSYHKSYHSKARVDALIMTVAIMRYRLEKGNLPYELNQLVQAGYLSSLPLDPYSNLPFVYRTTSRDFLIYSLGPDFEDGGGMESFEKGGIVVGDYVFWPFEEK
jgi:membrane protease YdiL (CAAX protease family)